MIGKALLNLADIANSISGDFHTLHLNMRGSEFDTMHKEVLKTYYEEAANDYDSWAEASLMFDDVKDVQNTNGSAQRISWTSFEGSVNKQTAVERTTLILTAYMEAAVSVFNSLSSKTDCPLCIGVSNTLQTRIEYWSKELAYFNARRS